MEGLKRAGRSLCRGVQFLRCPVWAQQSNIFSFNENFTVERCLTSLYSKPSFVARFIKKVFQDPDFLSPHDKIPV